MEELTFIESNKHRPITELALLLNNKPHLDSAFILAQINGIQKAKIKLPEFYSNPAIIYPSKLSMEQCSSEKTGSYKAKLIEGELLIDLTGGFGIDSFYFAKQFKQVTYIEQNNALFEIVKHNFDILKINNVNLVNSTAEDFLKTTKQRVDVVYIDPSRRNENQRVFKLNECTPNIIELAPTIFKITDKILVKTAPLLDIKQSIKDLGNVSKVFVVSVNNECKEVLYLLENKTKQKPQIHTINLGQNEQEFIFDFDLESNAKSSYSEPKKYLYEPNTSILKAGAFNCIGEQYELDKLHPNTHLYTSSVLKADFPGRIFKIQQIIPYQTKSFKRLGIEKINISCRNFKDNPEQIKKKLKIKDGGKNYLFATSDLNNKPILISCVK